MTTTTQTRVVHAVVWRTENLDGFDWFRKPEAAAEYADSEAKRTGFAHHIRPYQVPVDAPGFQVTGIIHEALRSGDYDEILGGSHDDEAAG